MNINKTFASLLHDKHRIIFMYGGRGSGKSHFQASKIVLQHLWEKGHKHAIIRKVGRTHRDSTFEQIRSCIVNENLGRLFKINKSDLRITYLPKQSEIVFMGLDDPEKTKSIANFTDIWLEEASEITENDFDIIDFNLRGEQYKVPLQITLTQNPINFLHWTKKRFIDNVDNDVLVHHSIYKDNAFIDDTYVQRLMKLKDKSPIKYDVYALGKWGRLGNLVYENYKIDNFDAYNENGDLLFDRTYNGLDWGFNNPAAGIKMALKDDVIYIIDEFYIKGKSNEELKQYGKSLWDKENDIITADSNEPKSIQEWRTTGWKMRKAKKEKGSIIHGIKWIQDKTIIIHPRCQNFINEIHSYVWRESKEGVKEYEEPVDVDNHLMDAMRYGLEQLMQERKLRFA